MRIVSNKTRVVLELIKYSGWILLFIVLWFNNFSNEEQTVVMAKVTVPEIKGKFEAKKPKHTPIATTRKTATGEVVYVENPINEELIQENIQLKIDFAKADSIQRVKLYDEAVQLSTFTSPPFEDENIKIDISGIVQGEVKEVFPLYKIKERKIEVPVKVKQTVFRLLGGTEIGNNTHFNDFKVKGNVMFQNRKGNIFSASYDTRETFWIGYNATLFEIKK